MMLFSRLLLALALLATPAAAQTGIQLGAGQLYANATAAQRPGAATNLSPLIDRAFNGNQGSILNRGASLWASTRTPVLGLNGAAAGTLGFAGLTSGTMTITPQAAAGTGALTLPNVAGTFAVGASAPLSLNAVSGNLTITGAAGQVLAGSGPAFTATPTLGVAGSTVGTLSFANATSGSVKLQPITGALGSAVLTLPAITDTLAGFALANGGTNNALTASNGGIVYSDASKLNILAGTVTANQCLLSGSNAAPSWGSCSASGVASINTLSGAITLANSNGLLLGTVGNTLTYSADIATQANIFAAASNKVLDAATVFNSAGALVSLSGTTTVTPDFSTGFNFTFTATTATNYTLANPTNQKTGQTGCIILNQPAAGSVVTISYGSQWKTAAGTTGKILTATLSATDMICYFVRIANTQIIFSLTNNVQ